MHALCALLKKFEWVHTTLGILGNTLFVVGSVFFLYESLKTAGVWLFIVGSALMLVGALGSGIVKLWRTEERGDEGRRQAA